MKTKLIVIGIMFSALASATHAQSATDLPLPAGLATGFTANTAPDALSRSVLSKAVPSLYHGWIPGTNRFTQLHQNFPQLIEQSFASMDRVAAGRAIDRLNQAELSDLAQLYVTAAANAHRESRLLPLLASRLRAPQLIRLAQHFGTADVAAAVSVSADASTRAAFVNSMYGKVYQAPVAGGKRFGKNGGLYREPAKMKTIVYMPTTDKDAIESSALAFGGVTGARMLMVQEGSPSWVAALEQSMAELYFTYRVSPGIGLLSQRAAMVATATMWGKTAVWTWGVFYGGGLLVSAFMQEYVPSLWEGLGNAEGKTIEAIDKFIETVHYDDTYVMGPAEKAVAEAAQLDGGEVAYFETTGGQYGETREWKPYADGGPDHVGCWGSGGIAPTGPESSAKTPTGPTANGKVAAPPTTNMCL